MKGKATGALKYSVDTTTPGKRKHVGTPASSYVLDLTNLALEACLLEQIWKKDTKFSLMENIFRKVM